MFINLKQIIYLFLIITTTLFASQKQTDNIASISATSLYNINKISLQNTIKAYIKTNPNLKALKIVESLSKETYISIYKDEKGNLIEEKLPNDLEKYQSFKSLSKYENEVVGEITAYFSKASKGIKLNAKEISWIKNNPAINIAVVDNYPPYDFRDKNNNLIGFHSDLVKAINEKLGTNIVLKPFSSWKLAYDAASKGTIHSISSLSWSKQREEKYFIYSSPYHFTPYHLVVQKQDNSINSLLNLDNKNIVVEVNTIFKDFLKQRVPSANIILANDTNRAYEMVSNAKASATISPNINDELLNKYGLKIASEIYDKSSNLYIGTNKKYPIVASILSKSIESLSLKQRATLRDKWFKKDKSFLKLTQKEEQWISNNPIIKIGLMNYWVSDDKGNSIHSDLLKLLNKYSGLNFLPIRYETWKDGFQDAVEGKVLHGILNLSWTKQREKENFYYTKAYHFTPSQLIVKKTNKSINSIKDLSNKTVYLRENSITNKTIKEQIPSAKIITLSNKKDMYKMLASSQEVDALLDYSLDEELINNNNLKIVQNVYDKYSEVSLGVSKQYPILKSIINKIYQKIPKNELLDLQTKVYKKVKKTSSIHLSDAEKEWIKKHSKIRVGNEPDYAPWDFTKNGEPTGYSIDYVNLLASKIGIEIEYVQDTWGNLIQKLLDKEIDALHTIFKNNSRKNIIYTNKYKNVINAIYVHEDNNNIKSSQDLKNKTISIPKGDSISFALQKSFPNAKIIEPEGYIESLKSVAFNKSDATILDMAVANYLKNEFAIPNLKIVDQVKLSSKDVEYSYRIGVRDDYSILVSILNKAINSLSNDELQDLDTKWILNIEKDKKELISEEKKDLTLWDILPIKESLTGLVIFLIIFYFIWKYQIKSSNKDFALKGTLFVTIGLFLFFASLITLVTLQNLEKSQKYEVQESLKSVIDTSYNTIKIWIDAKFRRFDVILDNDNVVKKMENLDIKENLLYIQNHFNSLKKVFEDSTYYLISNDEKLILSSEKNYSLNSFDIKAIQKIKDEDDLKKLVIFPSKNKKELQENILFIKAIKNKSGKNLTYLVMVVDTKKEFTKILQNGRIGKSGESYAFNEDLQLISNSRFDEELIKRGLLKKEQKSILNISIKTLNKEPTHLAKKALDKSSGINTLGYKDYRGVNVYGAWIWDENLKIAFATEIDESEAMGAFENMKKTIIVIVFSIVLFTIFLTALVAWVSTKSKKSLEKANSELNKLLNSFDENVIASRTDLKGTITYVSKAFCKISGYKEDELLGKPQSIVRHEDTSKELFKELWQTIQNGKVWKGELKNRKKDGSFYWVDAIISPEFDDDNEIVGFSAIREDITSKKEVEDLSSNQAIQMAEIERSNRLLNGREMKMIELKNQINEYRVRLGEEKLYNVGDKVEIIEETDININFDDEDNQEEFINLLDGKELQILMENFYKIMKIPLAIIDLKGNILVQSKWQKACTDFHRANSESCKRCIESDIDIASKLDGGQKFTSYKCSNGLIDCGSPITINGKYVANFFIGQFLVNEPDMEYFKNQGKFFGYNEEEYLESIRDIPVIKEEMLPHILGFLTGITNIVTSISIEKIEAQKYNKMAKNREIEMKKGQIAALNLAEDAENARVELVKHQEHLEELIVERTKELALNQEQMTYVSQFANLGFWNFNPQIGDLYVNDIFVMMLGYNPDEVLLKGYESEMFKPFKDGLAFWEQLLHPDDAQRTGEIITAHINGETDLYKVEYRMRRADGSWMWSLAVGKIAEYDEDGKPIRFNGVNLDIQESKDAQEKIAQNKLFVDTLLNSQEQIVITTDGQTLKSCNDAFLELFHIENMEEFTKDHDCICDRFEIDETNTYLQKYMGELSWIEYVLSNENKTHKAVIKKDDKERIFTVTAAILPIGKGDIKSAVFTDITELEFQKKQTDTILSSVLLPMLITNKKTRKIVYANSFAEEQYETTMEELLGLDINVFYTSEYQRDEILNELNTKGMLQNFETKFKTMKGKEFDAILSLVDISFGGEDCFLGVASDITNQKELQKEIESIHKHTRESIEYASLIQHALIPSNDLFRKYFNDYLTIWHPKDIVGGDIYLFEELRDDNECLLMVIDCTGHGVPGAFVTMLVKAIERQITSNIINSDEIVSPSKILSIFNRSMKHLLKQEDDNSISNAGFDGAVIYYNKQEKILKFSGAETPLFYVEDEELKSIKGSRHSIGYKKSDANFEFKEHILEVKEGMQFYLTTDGYLDQNGGAKGFPFGKKRFSKIIEDNHSLPFADQQEILLYDMQDYQGSEERNDDITIVGIKI